MSTQSPTRPPTLAGRISAIAAKLGAVGLDGVNQQQHFKFTSEGAIKRKLNPLLHEMGVAVICRGVAGDVTWESRSTRAGGSQQVCRFLVTYSIVNTDDVQDAIDVTLPTEGVDIADKALWKALTSATKNLLINTFSIVRSDDEDPDAHTPEEAAHVRPIGPRAAERFVEAASRYGIDPPAALAAAGDVVGRRLADVKQLAQVDRDHLEALGDLVADWKAQSGFDQVFPDGDATPKAGDGEGAAPAEGDDAGQADEDHDDGDEALDLSPPASIERMTVREIKRELVRAFEAEEVVADDVPRLVRKVLASAGMKLPDGDLRKAELAAALVAVRSGHWDLPTGQRIPPASA